jgi:hypothetical protein
MSGDPSALILNLAFSGSYLSRVGSSSTPPWRPSVHQLGSKRSDEASGKVSQPREGSILRQPSVIIGGGQNWIRLGLIYSGVL